MSESGNLENGITIADLYGTAVENGNDGIIVYNVDDCGNYVSSKDKFSTILGIVSESQIKY